MVMSRKTLSPISASSSRLTLEVVRTKIPTAHAMAAKAITTSATRSPGSRSGKMWRNNTATHTTRARPERFQARTVRSRAGLLPPGPPAPPALPGQPLRLNLPEGGDHHGQDADHHDADGEDERHAGSREWLAAAHGPLVGPPVPEALGRHDSTKSNER